MSGKGFSLIVECACRELILVRTKTVSSFEEPVDAGVVVRARVGSTDVGTLNVADVVVTAFPDVFRALEPRFLFFFPCEVVDAEGIDVVIFIGTSFWRSISLRKSAISLARVSVTNLITDACWLISLGLVRTGEGGLDLLSNTGGLLKSIGSSTKSAHELGISIMG